MTRLNNENLSEVAGGGTDITSYEDAKSIAMQLGPKEGAEFIKEWAKFHQDLYNEHKTEFDNLFAYQECLCKDCQANDNLNA